MMKLFILLLLSSIVLIAPPLSVFGEKEVYEPQLDSVTSSYDNSTNSWFVHVEGSNFYPNYRVFYIYVHEEEYIIANSEYYFYTDEYGNFSVDINMRYGHIESGKYNIEIYELKTYQFTEYIEFGDYPEDSIKWEITMTPTTEDEEVLIEVSGVVNFEQDTIGNNYGNVRIYDQDTGNSFFNVSIRTDEVGTFQSGDLVINPPAGKHEVVMFYDGLLRYGTYIVEPYEVEEEVIIVTTDKTTYFEGDTVEITGEVVQFFEGYSLSVIVLAPNGNTVSIQQVVVDADKKFSASITAGGSLFQSEGIYTITVQYGSSKDNSGTTTFNYIINDETIPEPTEPIDPESKIQFQTDKLTYYQNEEIIVNGTMTDVDWSGNLDVLYKIYENGNVIFTANNYILKSDILSPSIPKMHEAVNYIGEYTFELVIPLEILDHTGIFDVTITIQDVSNSISIMYIDTPNMENETLYNHIMNDRNKIKENELSIILLEGVMKNILEEMEELVKFVNGMFR